MKLAISRIHFPVTTLGPGRRVGIWFQGCSIHCPGCISADTWAKRRPDQPVSELLESIGDWFAQSDGVTISGGEPFEQLEGLEKLLRGIRSKWNLSTLVYSGLSFKELKAYSLVKSGLIDALISEPYLQYEDQTKPLRGSDNQKLNLLTERGNQLFGQFEHSTNQFANSLDVMFDADGVVWFAGIPRRGDIKKLQEILADQGNSIITTEARR